MNTSNKNQLNRNQNPPQANAEVARPKAKTIKLGIDVHLHRYVAVRLIDGGTPQPSQVSVPAIVEFWLDGPPLPLPVGYAKPNRATSDSLGEKE